MPLEKLDHIALWVSDRDSIADAVTSRLGMHVIDRTDAFTLVGSNARRGKLTLFAAEGPRERGALAHVGLRVNDLAAARDALGGEEATLADGLVVRLVEGPTDQDYDLDHVAIYSRDPEATAERYVDQLGFEPAEPGPGGEPRVEVGGAYVVFLEGEPGDPESPLLNHVAVLVPSADEQLAESERLGVEVADVVDAANTKAVFVWGPERVKVEYVEHKPTFSLV
ncbi:MAG TPA: VOC family protein [Gaiellaceae bacterium]|nr:VOC family protein [Gaiellaceae bacterium]HSJ93427.1 VOC family protein [Gaiellaceae bacterium]